MVAKNAVTIQNIGILLVSISNEVSTNGEIIPMFWIVTAFLATNGSHVTSRSRQ